MTKSTKSVHFAPVNRCGGGMLLLKIVTSGFLSFSLLGLPAFAGDGPSFTLQGKPGMQFRVSLEPVECIKKNGKKVVQFPCTVTAVDPIVLAIGPPLTLTGSEHKFDLLEGIKRYTKIIKTEEYPISAYGGVCASLLQGPGEKAITRCGPINGGVKF